MVKTKKIEISVDSYERTRNGKKEKVSGYKRKQKKAYIDTTWIESKEVARALRKIEKEKREAGEYKTMPEGSFLTQDKKRRSDVVYAKPNKDWASRPDEVDSEGIDTPGSTWEPKKREIGIKKN